MTGREIADALLDELQAHGLAGTVSWDRRHPRIRWTSNGREHSLPFAGSPSDQRSLVNSVAELRRRLREGQQ